ncbi:MAG: GNAT family N-acetyltransferase [Eubacteriales bacterium]|nr:GNAT family N-acetyltransferase [Eubacteriales bacterium]
MRGFFRNLFPKNEGYIYLSLHNKLPQEAELGLKYTLVYNICLKQRVAKHNVGYISLRVGESPALYYLGHVGYRIDPEYRGHGYAAKAVELIKQPAYSANMRSLVITCDVDNMASRKTCLNSGCEFEQIVDVPLQYHEICMDSKKKCRYILFTEEEI